MTTGINEPGSPNENGQEPQVTDLPVGTEAAVTSEVTAEELVNNPGHPAWQEILDVLPTSLHDIVRPTLQKWDTGVQEKLTSVRDEYSDYQEFVKGDVDPETIKQSLWLLDQLQTDPESVAKQIIDAWELDLIPKDSPAVVTPVVSTPNDPEELLTNGEFDITKHPEFVAMKQIVDSMQSDSVEQKRVREEADANAFTDNTLKELHATHGDFDDTFVLAFMSQGQDGAKAVKRYQDTVNQAAARLAGDNSSTQNTTEDPVVMGGNSATGSGLPSNPVQFGTMKASEREQLVADLLSKSQQT